MESFSVNKFCQTLSRLRVTSHKLLIEAGRWVKPVKIPVDDRKCAICNKLEDEYHFVLECSIYVDLRKQYILRKFWVRPSMFKFIELINNENKKITRNLGTYIHNAFMLRNSVLHVTD